MRKSITIKKIVIVLLFSVFTLSLIRQIIIVNRIKADIVVKSQELEELKEKNNKLSAELERAQTNNDYLEKLARERLGLIKEGEQVVIPSTPQE